MPDEKQDIPQQDDDDVDAHLIKEALAAGTMSAALFAGSARAMPVDPGQPGDVTAAQTDHSLAGKKAQTKKQKKVQTQQRRDGTHGQVTDG
jgi:hypothetical protein